jgi:hypothetical protein
MLVRLACVALIAVGSVLLAGCGPAKLDVSKSYTLEHGSADGFVLQKQSKPQKITIEFSSSKGEVTVLLFKATDATEENYDVAEKEKAMGYKTGKSDTLVVDVPENTETRFVIRGAKENTKVDVRVKN